jgi:hypothetical protein
LAWLVTTSLGIPLFIVDLGVLAWVKFSNHTPTASWAVIAVLVPAVAGFAWFVVRFYVLIVRRNLRALTRPLARQLAARQHSLLPAPPHAVLV